MDYQKVLSIYSSIENTSFQNLKNDLLESAIRYSRLRVDWQLADLEGRRNLELERTAAHNTFIDSCNILSRSMTKAGEEIKWREQLGNDRKTIGDFACYLNCILGISAR